MLGEVLIIQSESNYDQILTYDLGGDSSVAMGSLVTVRVRAQLREGLLLKVHENPPPNLRLKMVENILVEQVLSPQSIDLAYWLSRYYVCSLNKVVPLFLPPPMRYKEEKRLTLGGAYDPLLVLGADEKRLLETVKACPQGCTLERLKRSVGPGCTETVQALVKNELLTYTRSFIPQAKTKTEMVLTLGEQIPDLEKLKIRAPRQAAIYSLVQEGPLSWEALRQKGEGLATVKTLIKKGFLKAETQSKTRDPFLERLGTSRPQQMNQKQQELADLLSANLEARMKWLLFGVTGSGKTEVYLQVIEKCLALGRQVLYLVPEIALTTQSIAVLLAAFGPKVALLHSALSVGERYDQWMRIRKGEAQVILGPRSALFAPMTHLGLIIIDEEHENTYKQSEPDPRYDARRTAEKVAELHGATLLAGSATPSLRTFFRAQGKEYQLLRLPERVADRPLPDVKIIDLRREAKGGHTSIYSRPLIEALQKTIASGEQAILFMNRRGFNTFVLCRECGSSLNCSQCAIALTYHQGQGRLVCHYCNTQRPLPSQCPSCGSRFIHYQGVGTERVCQELENIFPGVKYLRMDADTTRNKGSHTQILKAFQEGKAQVLIGTQMIAKGLDFPEVTLVGIINADTLLNMPDYQSAERSYQLMSQVAGRAGRGNKPGTVLVQTYHPEHYVFSALVQHDYERFYQQEIENRRALEYPPYHFLVRIVVSGFQEKKVKERVDYLAELLKIEIEKEEGNTQILGPSPAPLYFLKGRSRYHIILKSAHLDDLQRLAWMIKDKTKDLSPEPRTLIDIEPQTLF